MTKGELVKALEKWPDDWPVYIGGFDIETIARVEMDRPFDGDDPAVMIVPEVE